MTAKVRPTVPRRTVEFTEDSAAPKESATLRKAEVRADSPDGAVGEDALTRELLASNAPLEEQVSALHARLSDLILRHETVKDAAQTLHVMFSQQRQESESLRVEKGDLQASLMEQRQELESLRVEKADLQQGFMQVTAQVEQLEADARSASDERHQLQEALGRVNESLTRAEGLVAKIRERLKRQEEDNRRLVAQAKGLNQESAILRKDLSASEVRERSLEEALERIALSYVEMQHSLLASETTSRRTNEAVIAISAECERIRAQLVAALSRGQQAEGWEAQVVVERSQRIRLQSALLEALHANQGLAHQIDGILASRSYRYGRRLTAPGRALFGSTPSRETQ